MTVLMMMMTDFARIYQFMMFSLVLESRIISCGHNVPRMQVFESTNIISCFTVHILISASDLFALTLVTDD